MVLARKAVGCAGRRRGGGPHAIAQRRDPRGAWRILRAGRAAADRRPAGRERARNRRGRGGTFFGTRGLRGADGVRASQREPALPPCCTKTL